MVKTVLITGASRGFGKHTALLFKSKGWNVAATMRTPENAESWTKAADLFTPKLDVTDRESMKAAIDETIDRFGRIDVLVNNAGFALLGPLEGVSAENLQKQFEGLTETLQYEVAQHGIRLKLVEPRGAKTSFGGSSMIKTPHPAYHALMTGFERAMRSMEPRLPGPEKVAKMIYHAATDRSSRLRYPVIAFPMITIRKLFGARIWTALMSLWVSSMLKKRPA